MTIIHNESFSEPEPSLARFVAYWTPERRAQRVAEELQS